MKKKMTIIGLLVFVCVLFLAVGYAKVTGSATLTTGMQGFYDKENLKFGYLADSNGYLADDILNDVIRGTNIKLNKDSIGYISGFTSDKKKISDDSFDGDYGVYSGLYYFNYNFSTKGDEATLYLPIVNASNDLRVTNLTVKVDKAFEDERCAKVYDVDSAKIVFFTGSNPEEASSYSEKTGGYLNPYSTLDDWAEAFEDKNPHAIAFAKIHMVTLHTIDDDLIELTGGSNYDSLCKFKVTIEGEPALNVD